MMKLTIEKMIEMDPRIGELLAEAPGQPWYTPGGFKGRVTKLVGFRRDEGPEELQTMEAYDVLYQAACKLCNTRKSAPLPSFGGLICLADVKVKGTR